AAVKTSGESTHFAACDAAQLIAEVVADAQIAPPIVLELKLAPLPQVWWDGEQMKIVLRNLLVNAREAMPNGGVLQVHAHSDETHVSLIVRDEGVGLAPEFIKHRLFRPNQTTKTKGLGLGLYQSREIVRAHRGEILVESALGKGTKF
ncbi:MAG: ATP-binding protein, partial [candidate division KSB1 bacterium]